MQAFATLYAQLDQSRATRDKLAALREGLSRLDAEDAAWTLHVLLGGKLKRLVSTAALRQLAAEAAELPDWMVEACHAHVGDLAETLALLVPGRGIEADPGLAAWMRRLEALRGGFGTPAHGRLADSRAGQRLIAYWRGLDAGPRLVLNKLLTGALRVGVSRGLVQRAVAELAGLDPALIAHRMMGPWQPSAAAWHALLAPSGSAVETWRPYPFALASPLNGPPEALGPVTDWLAEWKWDGIRAQLIRRDGARSSLWSRGEERLDGRFPEIEQAAERLTPCCVLDGEILCWDPHSQRPRPFTDLQKRIGRLRPGTRLLLSHPVIFLAYDLLELDGADLRGLALRQRRRKLEALLGEAPPALGLSPRLQASDWPALQARWAHARARGVEGLMLKRLDSPYRGGRRRGDWWKWKVAPYTIDAVMVYAQAGHGRRATLYTDYTFAVWHDGALLPVAKAYSGLDDSEIVALDRWIRQHTRQRYGPVRAVEPSQVFELAFEAINVSARHKAGLALRFPRILRWRRDKLAGDADTLESLRALAGGSGARRPGAPA